MNLTDSALIRINRGANTIHTYSGQRTAQQNGYVYVYASNEIVRFAHTIKNNKQVHGQIDRFAHTTKNNKQVHGQSQFDVWFDDLFVTHRTGPLLQEAHFYPFGQEITPLSSKALLKTPNDRMLQQNEWDEEFGLDLHDFDARLYDASIGRFWGVDVYAEKFARLSPYNYAANNPYHFVDPDGRIIFALAAKLILKGATKAIIKKLAAKAGKKTVLKMGGGKWGGLASAASYAKTHTALTTASKIGSWVGGASNVARNWDRITASGTGEGIFRFANFFLAGSAGGQLAAIGTPLATFGGMVLGGALNVEADFLTMDGTLDSREGLFRSFSRGALSALSGKAMAKSFVKGANVKVGPDWSNTWWGQGITGGVEKGFETVMTNYNQYGDYGLKAYGKGFYRQSLWAGMAGGFVKGAVGGLFSEWEKGLNKTQRVKLYDLSLFSVSMSNLGGDATKKFMLKSMNKEYKESLKGQSQGPFNFFFNGVFPMFLYHTAAGL
jgi:RHS repeat-associated protein